MTIRDTHSKPGDREKVSSDMRGPSASTRDATRGFLDILWRRKGTFLATVLICLAIGILYIVVTPPRYMGSTAMLIDPRLGKTVGTDPVQPGYVVDTGAMDSQIKLFTSQTVLSRVAKMANLADDPEFNGTQRSLWQRLFHPDGIALEDKVDLKALEEAITIKRPERTYVVGIDVLARSPKKAAEIANDLTAAYIDDQVHARLDAAQDDTKFVREQMTKLSDTIKISEDKVEDFKTRHNIVDANGLRSNEQQVGDLTKALGEARAKTSDAEARLAEMRRIENRGQLDGSSGAMKSFTIERLRQQQAETEQNVSKLATILGRRHPELMEAKAREGKINGLITDELRRLITSATGDYLSAKQNEEQILRQLDRIKGQSTEISRDLVPLAQLERNVKILRASFDRFAQIRDNITQQEADSPPGRVIAVARPPVSAASPKKKIVMLLSLSAGVFLGIAASLFAEGNERPLEQEPPKPSDAPVPFPETKPQARPTRRYWDDDDTQI